MVEKGTEVEVAKVPPCDICAKDQEQALPVLINVAPAAYDAKTIFGPWAYLCEAHFREYGPERLGVGAGQRLILKGGTSNG